MKQLLATILLCTISVFSFSQKNGLFRSSNEVKDDDSLKLFSGTLNYLFKNQLTSIAYTSEDVSLQRYYANITNEDNAFSFGFNFNNLTKEEDRDKKPTWIISLGVGAKSIGNFATIYKNSKVQTEINGKLKFTWVGRGIITRDSNQMTMSNNYFNKYLNVKYTKKYNDYLKPGQGLEDEITKKNALLVSIVTSEDSLKLKNEYLKTLKSSLMEEEATAILENKLYKRLWDHWVTFEATLPFSRKEYKISDSIIDPNYSKKRFYGWNFSLKYTNMWKWSNNNAVYLSGRGRTFNNNNILTEDLNSADFLSFVNQSSSQSATTESNEVYVGRFDEFVSVGISAELIYFPWNKYAGISASIEPLFGSTNYINWKLGVPVSLKDKEGKPVVNFELQWKEVNKNHFIGLDVGFVLGKFVG